MNQKLDARVLSSDLLPQSKDHENSPVPKSVYTDLSLRVDPQHPEHDERRSLGGTLGVLEGITSDTSSIAENLVRDKGGPRLPLRSCEQRENQRTPEEELQDKKILEIARLEVLRHLIAQQLMEQGEKIESLPPLSASAEAYLKTINSLCQPDGRDLTEAEKLNYLAQTCEQPILSNGVGPNQIDAIKVILMLEQCMNIQDGGKLHPNHLVVIDKLIADTIEEHRREATADRIGKA